MYVSAGTAGEAFFFFPSTLLISDGQTRGLPASQTSLPLSGAHRVNSTAIFISSFFFPPHCALQGCASVFLRCRDAWCKPSPEW